MDNNEKIRAMAAIVSALEDEFNVENHRTTGAQFMYGDLNQMKPFDQAERQKRRSAIMGQIGQMRTEAIWELSKLLSSEDHRIGRELLDAQRGRNSLFNALALAVAACDADSIKTVH